ARRWYARGVGFFSFVRWRAAYTEFLDALLGYRALLLTGYVVLSAAVIWLAGSTRGREIFPAVDSGQFQLRIRAPAGTRIERTEDIARQALDFIGQTVGPANVAMTVGFGG